MTDTTTASRRKTRPRQWPLWRLCMLAAGVVLLAYGLGLYPPVLSEAWWMFTAGMTLLMLAVSYIDDRRSR